MKEFSKEIIEIDGKEYTLFLNRLGVVAFEKFTEKCQNDIKDIASDVKNLVEKNSGKETEITNDTNPFEDEFLKETEELLERVEKNSNEVSQRIYWIMLYTEHKFSLDEAKELYNKACEEYGREQVDALATQMLEEVNSNKFGNEHKELKNLKALHQPKK